MGIEDFYKSYPKRTVCEVTREIFDIIKEIEPYDKKLYDRIFLKLLEQMRMQKKMDLRLRFMKSTYESEYADNPNHKEIGQKREALR